MRPFIDFCQEQTDSLKRIVDKLEKEAESSSEEGEESESSSEELMVNNRPKRAIQKKQDSDFVYSKVQSFQAKEKGGSESEREQDDGDEEEGGYRQAGDEDQEESRMKDMLKSKIRVAHDEYDVEAVQLDQMEIVKRSRAKAKKDFEAVV